MDKIIDLISAVTAVSLIAFIAGVAFGYVEIYIGKRK